MHRVLLISGIKVVCAYIHLFSYQAESRRKTHLQWGKNSDYHN